MTKTHFNMNFNLGYDNGYYYNYGLNGYKGFDFSDIYYFSAKGIDTYYPHEHTGYNNDLHGSGLAFSLAEDNTPTGYGWGAFYSPNKETFTLTSADVAPAWDSEQTVKFTTYKGSHRVASVYISVSINGQKIDFANYGSDFKNITKLRFGTNNSYAVNQSSTYGKGWQVVIDNVKGWWNGPEPKAIGAHHHAHISQPLFGGVGHLTAQASAVSGHDAQTEPGSAHETYRSVLTSLDTALGHHDGGGLTAEFLLPGTEHFTV